MLRTVEDMVRGGVHKQRIPNLVVIDRWQAYAFVRLSSLIECLDSEDNAHNKGWIQLR